MNTTSLIPRERPIATLLDFIAGWVPELSTKHRVEPSLIPSFVPPPLRAIYELTGNYPVPYDEPWRPGMRISRLFATEDWLLPFHQLVVRGDRFTFIEENQNVWSCETLINKDDPPVFSSSCDDSGTEIREVCPSLSHFLTTFCLRELVFGSQNLLWLESGPANPGELVKGDLVPLWLDGKYSYEAKDSFFLCGRNLMVMSGSWCGRAACWLAYNRKEASKLLRARRKAHRIH